MFIWVMILHNNVFFFPEDCELGTEFVRLELGVACRACAINTYRDSREMPMCAPCPLNTYTLQPGSMRCLTVTQVVELGRFGYRIGGRSGATVYTHSTNHHPLVDVVYI